jgi:UDP-glucose 4-epimerase
MNAVTPASSAAPRLLLTGGAGYIGSHTAVTLLNAGCDVVIIDNLSNSNAASVDAVQKITGRPVSFHPIDLRDQAGVEAVLREERIDAVVHLAGLKAVGESCDQPLAYYDCNVVGTLRLLQAMQATGVRQLVFSSSATVYGDPQFLPYTEAHPTAPTSPYGNTKRQIEVILQDLSHSAKGWHFSVLRYFNPVGAHDSGDLGEDPRGIPNNLMPFIAQVAVGKRAALTIHGDDYDTVDGTGVRDYIHVCDLADGHWAALQHLMRSASAETSACHVFNLGSGVGHSVKAMVSAFERACGQALPVQIGPRRAGDLPAFWADASRARDILHWQPTRDLDSMCASTWRWQQAHPNGFNPT